MNQQIQNFNQQLIDDEIELTIIDYVKKLNEQFYNIDISFIDEFIDLVEKEGFVIHHNMLEKNEVIVINNNTGHVKRLLDQHSFKEGKDYKTCCPDQDSRLEYPLKSDVFKKILIRSKNTDKYADYYLILEKAIKYYNQYQIQKLNKKLQSICEDRVLKLQDDDKSECFVVLENKEFEEYPYSIIRGQQKNLQKTLTKLSKSKDDILINMNCCYASNLYNKIKERLTGCIRVQKKYLHINKEGNVLE